MREIKRVKAAEMFPIINEILHQGGKSWITVTGMSMYPFLREDKDSVELAGCNFKTIKRGDIVLIQRKSGEYVLHRVLRKEAKAFYMIGDAQQWIEGPLEPNQLMAVVSAVRRGNYTIDCKNPIWKLLTRLWLRMIPVRHYFLRGISVLSRAYRLVKRHGDTLGNYINRTK